MKSTCAILASSLLFTETQAVTLSNKQSSGLDNLPTDGAKAFDYTYKFPWSGPEEAPPKGTFLFNDFVLLALQSKFGMDAMFVMHTAIEAFKKADTDNSGYIKIEDLYNNEELIGILGWL